MNVLFWKSIFKLWMVSVAGVAGHPVNGIALKYCFSVAVANILNGLPLADHPTSTIFVRLDLALVNHLDLNFFQVVCVRE